MKTVTGISRPPCMRGDRRYLESTTVTLASLNIEVVSVPANMTHFFQPLDLTVNREAKKFIKDQFTSWYSAQIQSQLDSGVVLDDVDVDLRLSVLKPIHATWIVSMYNHLSSSEGRQSIAKGWKKAGVTDVVSGSKKLPPEDPFEDLDVSEPCGL